MEFIATYWWIWLLCLLVCGGFGIWKWFMSFFKTAGTILRASNLTLETVQLVSDEKKSVSEKAQHARGRVVEEVTKEGKSRLWDFGMAGAAIIAANIFGVLLIIAVIVMLIDHFNAGGG